MAPVKHSVRLRQLAARKTLGMPSQAVVLGALIGLRRSPATAKDPESLTRDAAAAFSQRGSPKSTSRGAIDASLPRAAETPHDGHRPPARPHEGVLPLGRR